MKRALALPQWYLPEMNREAPQKVRPVFWGISPDDASLLYCSDEILRRAVRTACATRKAGTPDPQAGTPGLLNVLREYACGGRPETGALARGPTHSGRRFRRFVTRTYA